MLEFSLCILILVNVLFSYSKRKSKVLIFISSIFIAVVFAGSRDMADWENYYNDYLYGDQNYDKNGQFLYYYIVRFFKYLGCSFEGFRFVISLVFLSFYYKFIIKYSQKPNLVYAGYLCYLMFLDDVQIRNFIAAAILLQGISIIIEHKKKWRIKYFLIVVMASFVHNSFWIYLLYLLIPSDINNGSIVNKIGFIGLIMTVIAVIIRPFISNIVLLFSLVVGEKATGYAETEIGLGGLIYACIQVLAVIGVYYILRAYNKNNSVTIIKGKLYSQNILKTILLIDILSFMLLPPIILALTFNRLVRNLFIMNIVAFTYGIKEKETRLVSLLTYVTYIVIFAYFDLATDMGQRIIIEPFFNNNIYF